MFKCSAICNLFYSKIPQNGCAGINFSVQELSHILVYFCCPPTKEIVHTFKHLISFPNIQAVLVIPAWVSVSSGQFYRVGQIWEGNLKSFIFNPEFLIFNQTNSLFSRLPKFQMLALMIKTSCL